MKNFIPVDLGDPDLSEKLARYILKHPQLSAQVGSSTVGSYRSPTDFKLCTPLVEAVNKICSWSDISYIALFNFNTDVLIIHQDTPHDYKWALNIPILNCADTYTAFYEPLSLNNFRMPTVEEIKQVGSEGAEEQIKLWPEDQVKEIDRMYLTQPVLFNISSIHGVHNHTGLPRVSCSIRANCDLEEKYNMMQK